MTDLLAARTQMGMWLERRAMVLFMSPLLGSVLLFPLLLYLYRIFKGRVLPGG